MIRGLYTAASGMMAEASRNDVTANNLANVNTAGFKKDTAITKSFAEMLIQKVNDGEETAAVGTMGAGVALDETAINRTAGAMHHTGNDLDLAIDGPGYFTVETPTGTRYTRNGAFTKSAAGELVTADGYPVMGQGGRISVEGTKVVITDDGRISVDGIENDQLRLTAFADNIRLVKEGASLLAAPGGTQGEDATGLVRQGVLEQSNVNIVEEMVSLIAGMRAYEMNAKVVQTQDETLNKAVNDVGRL